VELVQLLDLDRLLDPAGGPAGPEARLVEAAAHPLRRVQLDLGVEGGDEGIELARVEGVDEAADELEVGGHRAAARRRGISCTSCRSHTSKDRCGRSSPGRT